MEDRIIILIIGIISIVLFILSLTHMYEKGFLFNNAYIYASKEEREKMNKRPYYRQSGIVFMFLGLITLLNAFNVELKMIELFIAVIVLVIITIIYAIVSTIIIEKKKGK